jgi:hypothetical protein
VIQPRVRAGESLLELSLVDVTSELRRDSQLVDGAAPGALEAAVTRLIEEVTPAAHPTPRLVAVESAPPPPRSWLARPSTWIAAGALVIAGVATAWALSHRTSSGAGFSSAVDPTRIGPSP